ncbi:unnamed protein product [Sphagnum balticum]
MAELRHQMDENFEYLHHELNERGFKDCVRHFMKGERSHLKKLYAKGGHQECPMGVERDEWEKLVEYWQGRETQKKAEIMASVRGAVVTISSYGCAGKVELPTTLGTMEAHAGFMAGGNKEPAATKATPILAEQNPVLVSVTGNAQTNGHAHVVLAVNKAVQQVDHRLEGSQVNHVLVAKAGMLGAEPARASRTTVSPTGHCNEQATDGKKVKKKNVHVLKPGVMTRHSSVPKLGTTAGKLGWHQLKVGESVLLCNPDCKSEVVGKGLILGIGGNGCVHHGKPIGEGWF